MNLSVPKNENFPRKLGLYYFLALGTIAITIIMSQALIQRHISNQELDSHVINTAGRQRMLSQKVSKLALQISEFNKRKINGQKAYAQLAETLKEWEKVHYYLSGGNTRNSTINKQNYKEIEPFFQTIVKSGKAICVNVNKDFSLLQAHVDNIMLTESNYLTLMDRIVLQYENEAREKLRILRKTEYVILVITLMLILAELLFVFRPLIAKTKRTIEKLTESERTATNMASQINKLYTELGKSYQDLEAINIKPEGDSLFLKISTDGTILHFSEEFKKVFEFSDINIPANLKEWLKKESYEKEFVNGLFEIIKENKPWSGEIRLTSELGDFIFLEIFMTSVLTNYQGVREVFVIAKNITELKEAQNRSREINLEKIEKSIKEQQYRSVLILEGQEEERKRIAREMHDGIGQMLTALKINMEAITPNSSVHTRKRLEDARHLLKRVLQEIRRVSFNLTPSSLIDFGIVPALRKFCSEVSVLSDVEVIFSNKSNFINRLDKNIETNLYRIVQEAVNNSIKYAKTKEIFVSFEHNFEAIDIVIADEGPGFDYVKLQGSGHFGKSGHGIFNMKERAGFINAKFDIETSVGNGTKIKISLPIIDKNYE